MLWAAPSLLCELAFEGLVLLEDKTSNNNKITMFVPEIA